MSPKLYKIVCGSILWALATSGMAASLVCTPKDDTGYWVRKVSINTVSRTASLDIVKLRTAKSTTLSTMSAVIERIDERQFGEPIFEFNAYPTPQVEVTNVFKLFKVFDKWRLISAGLVYVGNKPTLRAVGTGADFVCKDSG